MKKTYLLLLLLSYFGGFSQTLPESRRVDWTLAGLRETTTNGFTEINMQDHGIVGDGTTPNDAAIANAIASITPPGAILNFPSGNFLFNSTITLPSNVVIKGQGPTNTTFTIDLGGIGHAINISGTPLNSTTTTITDSATKDHNVIMVSDASSFSAGDWIKIIQTDSDLVTSSWAEKLVGQIIKITSINANEIVLDSPLRMDFNTDRSPYIIKINPVENVGVECLKIHRLDNTAPEQSSNINYYYAMNCWVKGIESENCTFSHIQANHSSNLYISKSYFYNGFEYGSGGRAYGVMLQSTSNECLIEDNIFEHLRHSMIVQSGANGNVFAYNYSLDPYWTTFPNNSAGDMVLHGNYTYANLFEQNIGQNIVIDNSHGPNGPNNTFLRNRSEGYGIFFSANNSPNQNFLGNEIPNTSIPYSLFNYNILGIDHFIHGNNNKGTIDPVNTATLPDESYAYSERPDFIPEAQWAGIGTSNVMGANFIPAYDRYHASTIFDNVCDDEALHIKTSLKSKENVLISPNPVLSEMTIESDSSIKRLTIINAMGQVLYHQRNLDVLNRINTSHWQNGIYFVHLDFSNRKSVTKMIVKSGL